MRDVRTDGCSTSDKVDFLSSRLIVVRTSLLLSQLLDHTHHLSSSLHRLRLLPKSQR
jgi:hypothetical protein